jgi:hypothetical protein
MSLAFAKRKKTDFNLAIVVVMSERFTAQSKGTTNWKSVARCSQYIAPYRKSIER